ncbi:TonB-dependent receptor domain-containing protein [Parvularcula marina]|uniref:TonB-dependent receptor domain-containing protein n=1 Tax=Parvularcula marina TaxID=2292771 RepID=UPI003512A7F9
MSTKGRHYLAFGTALLFAGNWAVADTLTDIKANGSSSANSNVSTTSELGVATQLTARDAIRSLARRAGLVIIYDSRKIREQVQVEIDPNATPKQALEQVLAGMDLQLEPVGTRTFAITQKVAAPPPQTSTLVPVLAAANFTDTIIVTGVSASTAPLGHETSVVEIDQDTIQLLSETKASDVIFDLPQTLASFSSANTTLLGATSGLNLADLRGLGPERTQVLVNGRRRTPMAGGNVTVFAVDLTTLPHEFVRQVEILDYSQAVSIGPEAVTGSINMVLDTQTDGLETGFRYGLSEKGDFEQKSAYLKWGNGFAGERGHIFGAVEFASEEGLLGADRAESSSPYGFAINGQKTSEEGADFVPGFSGSVITPDGLIAALVLDNGRRISAGQVLPNQLLTPDGGLEPYEARLDQFYNWSSRQSRILPNERLLAVGAIEYELTPQTDVYAEMHLGLGRTNVQTSPIPAVGSGGPDPISGDGIRISLDSPIVPDAIRDEITLFAGDQVDSIVLSKRLVALGDRQGKVDRGYVEFIAGGEKRTEGPTSYSGYYRFGQTTTEMTQYNLVSRSRLAIALDPDLCAATLGCVTANPFLSGGLDAAADYLRATSEPNRLTVTEHEFYADVATELDLKWGKSASLLAGVSWRHNEVDTVRPSSNADILTLARVTGYDGTEEQTDLFARFTLPLISDRAFISEFRVGGGGRFVHSDVSGWSENAEAFADWEILEGLSLRGVASYGERPPNLSELYLQAPGQGSVAFDPCSGLDPSEESVIVENCLAAGPLGVNSGYVSSGYLVTIPFLGNPDLEPETNYNWRADLIVEPHALFGWEGGRSRLRLSYTDLMIKGIFDLPAVNILDECYGSVNLSSEYCGTSTLTGEPYIVRNPVNDELVSYSYPLINQHEAEWKGLDFEARMTQRTSSLGPIDRVWATALHTHILEAEVSWAGTLTGSAAYPRDRTLVSAGFDIGRHEFAAQGQRRGEVRTAESDVELARIGTYTTYDLAWRSQLSENARLTATVNNLTDEAPQIAAFTDGLNVLAEHYDLIGRRFSIELEYKF